MGCKYKVNAVERWIVWKNDGSGLCLDLRCWSFV
jgi:hypothetical protein